MVAALLRGLGYYLPVKRKRITGPYDSDRVRQFGYIDAMVETFWAERLLVLSVHTQK